MQFNDGNHFGGCVDDVDGVVILTILLLGQRKSEKGDRGILVNMVMLQNW